MQFIRTFPFPRPRDHAPVPFTTTRTVLRGNTVAWIWTKEPDSLDIYQDITTMVSDTFTKIAEDHREPPPAPPAETVRIKPRKPNPVSIFEGIQE